MTIFSSIVSLLTLISGVSSQVGSYYKPKQSPLMDMPGAGQMVEDDADCEEQSSSLINPGFDFRPTIQNDFDPLPTFFNNLSKYSPYNSCNSCAFVALTQCLAYYDATYNDDIIPENFEKNQGNKTQLIDAVSVSPGVLRTSYPKCNGDLKLEWEKENKDLHEDEWSPKPEETEDFYSWVTDQALENDFQMFLIKEMNLMYNNSPLEYSCRYAIRSYEQLLNRIHSNSKYDIPNIHFSYQEETDSDKIKTQSVQDNFKSYIKTQIAKDNPVVVNICTFDKDDQRYISFCCLL